MRGTEGVGAVEQSSHPKVSHMLPVVGFSPENLHLRILRIRGRFMTKACLTAVALHAESDIRSAQAQQNPLTQPDHLAEAWPTAPRFWLGPTREA
jgi:hypothetical protein